MWAFISGSQRVASICAEILGLQDVSDPSEEVTRLRMDDAPWRIAVHVGKTNAGIRRLGRW